MSTLLGPGGQQLTGAAPVSAAADAAVVETTTQNFMGDVIEASRNAVVLVDFWAPWCGPCKTLAPVLEKAVKAFGGAVKLVKLNIDDHPEIPGQLGIRSIPAVIAFRQGQPMDGFVGAQTESQIKAFLERIAGPAQNSDEDQLAAAEEARANKDFETALTIYSAMLQGDPENLAAMAGLGHATLEAGDIESGEEIATTMTEMAPNDPLVQGLISAVKVARQAAALGGTAKLQAAFDVNPNDPQAEYELAVALAGAADRDRAVDHLVNIIRREPDWNDGAAKTELLSFFEAWGAKDPATLRGRRKLASVLFS